MTKENGVGHADVDEKSSTSQTHKSERHNDSNSIKQGNVHFKILVPSIAAGAIIGKGGEAITEIQNQTSAKVKMSKATAFYPGTTERVCLIIGTIESVLRVFQYISEKIHEKPETISRTNCEGRMPTERHKQVKILVPNSTAGMIIGKGGSFIKELKDTTGVFIQVSQKSKELNLAERCVTIAGELSQTREAVALILNKIAEDPQSSSCPNISYSEVNGPVASAYPTGSPYALTVGSNSGLPNCGLNFSSDGQFRLAAPGSGSNFTSHHMNSFSPIGPAHSNSTSGSMFCPSSSSAIAAAMAAIGAVDPCSPGTRNSAFASNSGRALIGRGVASSHSPNSHQTVGHSPHSLLGSVAAQFGAGSSAFTTPGSAPNSTSNISLEGIRNVLRTAGYSDVATEEIANAMNVLSLYGFISMSSLTGCTNSSPLTTTPTNTHFAMVTNALNNLNRSFPGYGSSGPQSPIFSNSYSSSDLQLRGFRNPGIASFSNQSCAPPHGQAYLPRRTSVTTSHSVHLNSNLRTSRLTNPNESTPGLSIIKDLKAHDPLCVTTSDPIVCRTIDHHNLEVSTGLYSSTTSGELLNQSPPRSPPLGIHDITSVSGLSLSLKQNNISAENLSIPCTINTAAVNNNTSNINKSNSNHNHNNGNALLHLVNDVTKIEDPNCTTVALSTTTTTIKSDTSRANNLWNM